MTTGRSARPRRSRAGFVLFLAVLVAAAWFVVDRLSTPSLSADELAFEARPYLMFGLKPDFTRKGEPPRTSNAQGYRGEALTVPKPAGRTRIVCLGGSTTYGYRVADGDTWPVRLQELLRAARPDLDLEVVNAGVESYTTAESLTNLAFHVLDLEPDVIVVHHNANDVRPRRYRGFDAGYTHYRKVWNGSTEGYRALGGELGGINSFIQHLPPDPPGDALENEAAAGTDTYRRNLVSIVALARGHGIDVVFTSMPYDPALAAQDPGLGEGMDEHNSLLRRLAPELGVPLVDLVTPFVGHPELFVDAIHLNPEGSLAKARPLAEELARRLP